MDIFKNLLTKKQKRNESLNYNLNSSKEAAEIDLLIGEGDFESSYLEFTSFNVLQNGQKFKTTILFYNNVGRNKKYLVTDFIRTSLCECIDLTIIATNVERRFDFKLFHKINYETNQISIFLKTIYK